MGQNTQNKKSLYEMLLNSIDGLDAVDKSIISDKAALTSFAGFLSQNEAAVSKFEGASNEVCTDLEEYNFSAGFNFGRIQHRIESLRPLRLKLVEMGEEAKKLSVFPDRYNSKNAIEACKKLAVACSEKMSFAEIDKVIQLVEANTQKLIELQKLFERDSEILSRINAMIKAEANTLKPLKAYYAELIQYVSEFPHNGHNDIEEVSNRISTAKRVTNCKLDVQDAAASIQDYYDRYNKGAVLARYADTIHQMSTSMRYSDVGIIEGQLKDVKNQIRKVIYAFEQEFQEVETLQASLQSHSAGLWKEDNERLLKSISGYLKNDIRKISFNLESFKNEISTAKQRRASKISSARIRYSWLNKEGTYKTEHDNLIQRNISEEEYKNAVNEWIIERHKWLLYLFVIPYFIWKWFIYQKFE